MYVSELFVGGECIIDSLAGLGKKLGVLGGDAPFIQFNPVDIRFM